MGSKRVTLTKWPPKGRKFQLKEEEIKHLEQEDRLRQHF